MRAACINLLLLSAVILLCTTAVDAQPLAMRIELAAPDTPVLAGGRRLKQLWATTAPHHLPVCIPSVLGGLCLVVIPYIIIIIHIVHMC